MVGTGGLPACLLLSCVGESNMKPVWVMNARACEQVRLCVCVFAFVCKRVCVPVIVKQASRSMTERERERRGEEKRGEESRGEVMQKRG